jgi:hypothetical protein
VTAWQDIADACRGEHARFLQALRHPEAAQAAQLRQILSANAASAAGRRHGFARLRDAQDYRNAVPIATYADIATEIERMVAGEPGRLAGADVVACELTSGSGATAKLIPYTNEGLAGFRHAAEPWLCDLLASRPGIARGRAYWAISPVSRRPARAATGVPVGLDDAQYLGPTLAPLFARLLAAPPGLRTMSDVASWRYWLLRYLLDAADLTFVSVWSPTFLLPLIETLQQEGDRLAHDLAAGAVSWSRADPATPRASFEPRPQRAQALRQALSAPVLDLTRLWPRLDTVSCWTHASAAPFAGLLAGHLPGVHIQGKGLLATEAAVSVPLEACEYPVLALHSGFFEFLDDDGRSRLAHELDSGGRYRIVVTTASGLYRYDLGDSVRVRGFAARTPMLEFVGRAGLVSDLCGEKLADDFVAGALDGIRGFAMVAPLPPPARGYALLLDTDGPEAGQADASAATVERRLQANPHYEYARRLGQLDPLAALRVHRPLDGLLGLGLARGSRLGQVKPAALCTSPDWADHFLVDGCDGTPVPVRADHHDRAGVQP